MTPTDELPHRKALRLQREAMMAAAKEPSTGKDELELPDTDDLRELARAAVPALVRKAVRLAHVSESLPAVLGVIKELGDRGWGKAEQSVHIEVSAPEQASQALRTLVVNGLITEEAAFTEAAALGIEWSKE